MRVWNLLNRRQEVILEYNTYIALSTAITDENKFIVSGLLNKTVQVWNLQDKSQEAV